MKLWLNLACSELPLRTKIANTSATRKLAATLSIAGERYFTNRSVNLSFNSGYPIDPAAHHPRGQDAGQERTQHIDRIRAVVRPRHLWIRATALRPNSASRYQSHDDRGMETTAAQMVEATINSAAAFLYAASPCLSDG